MNFQNGGLPPPISLFANAGPRLHDTLADGGGSISRVFYVEPYLAYPWVELFLKGTVVNNGGIWSRIKPHADPIKPFFYCASTHCIPFAPETVTGQALTAYAPSDDLSYNTGPAGGQQQQVTNVLNAVDDHGYTNILDFGGTTPPLTTNEIIHGGIPIVAQSAKRAFSGKCGAFIAATYRPLIFLDGPLSSGIDPFDCVLQSDWSSNEEVATQTGRSLFLYSPNPVAAIADNPLFLGGGLLAAVANFLKKFGAISSNTGNAGLSDTFSRAETITHYKIRRLMIPFEPQLTIGAYSKKINQINNVNLGNLTFPKWTIRFDHCDKDMKIAPDGQTYYDLTMHFSRRMLYEDMYDDLPDGTTWDGAAAPALKSIKAWITWNHHFAIPADRMTGTQVGAAGYYPVCWNGGVFQLFGDPRNLYLGDGQVSPQPAGYAGAFTGNMLVDLFTSGFRLNQ